MSIENDDINNDQDATVVYSLAAVQQRQQAADGIELEPQAAKPMAMSFQKIDSHSDNRLLDAGKNILVVLAELRRPQKNLDLVKFKQRVGLDLSSFDVKAKNAGIAESNVLIARYMICAAMDEFVLDTPWGANSNWSQNSLLSTFHQDSAGGQKFFDILDKLLREPDGQWELLELAYLCLSLGFLGKYRIFEKGHNQLTHLKQKLYQAIRLERGDVDRTLCLNPTPADAQKVNVIKRINWRKVTLMTVSPLIVIYLVLALTINHQGNKVVENFHELVIGNTTMQQNG